MVTFEESESIRADERARILYWLQRRVRIMDHVRGVDESLQQALDITGWLAETVEELNAGTEHVTHNYELHVPANDVEPRAVVRNIWRIEWQ